MIWITADLHIGHDREFIYKKRGFENAKQHDEVLLENWNRTVGEEDIVYILGDVLLKQNLQDDDFAYGVSVLGRLNGKLIIIRGNHDSEGKIEKFKLCPNVMSAGDAALYLEYEGKYHFYLSHYPTVISGNEKKKTIKHALINLYGHTHQKEHFYEGNPYMYCACLDAHDMKPVALEEIIEEIKLRKSCLTKGD